MLVDSHCHLDFAKEEDRAGIIARARGAGVRTLLTISTKLHEFPGVRAIAESDPDIWCSVGVHPHEAEVEPVAAEALIALTKHPKVVAIGETGLDFFYEHSPREQQGRSFARISPPRARPGCRSSSIRATPIPRRSRSSRKRSRKPASSIASRPAVNW